MEAGEKNMSEENGTRGSTHIERVVTHVIQALIVLAIAGFFYQDNKKTDALSSIKTEIAVQNTQLMAFRDHLGTFRSLVSDRYTGKDAARDLSIIHARNADYEKRLRALERVKTEPWRK